MPSPPCFAKGLALVALLALTHCGEEFAAGEGGAGAATASGTGTAGGGGVSTGGGGAGAAGGDGAAGGGEERPCGAGSVTPTEAFHSTLDDLGAITNPEVGSGADAQATSSAFFPSPSGHALLLAAAGEYVRWVQAYTGGTINLDPRSGMVDLCYRPHFVHLDGEDHVLLAVQTQSDAMMTVRKCGASNGNEIHANISDGVNVAQLVATPAAFQFETDRWYRVTVAWSLGGVSNVFRLYVDGTEVPLTGNLTDAMNMPSASNARYWFLGGRGAAEPFAPKADFDEVYVFAAPAEPLDP